MARYALTYGLLSGLLIILIILGAMTTGAVGHSLWFGYHVMLLGMSFIFVGVKRYRDVEGGGVVGFWRALAVGMSIAAVALIAYAAVWELYLALTHYTFMDEYTAGMIHNARARGVNGEALAKLEREAANMRALYARPLLRMGMTAAEPAPVALPIVLFSAALLRFPRVLPARR